MARDPYPEGPTGKREVKRWNGNADARLPRHIDDRHASSWTEALTMSGLQEPAVAAHVSQLGGSQDRRQREPVGGPSNRRAKLYIQMM
jgi:hypothetical protein